MSISLLVLLLLAPLADAEETISTVGAEIEFLISAIGESGCDFIRNGRRYSSRDAEEHIRMKYMRGRRHAPTADLFIERLASSSSMSKKPYWIDCAVHKRLKSEAWLKARLEEYRNAQQR